VPFFKAFAARCEKLVLKDQVVEDYGQLVLLIVKFLRPPEQRRKNKSELFDSVREEFNGALPCDDPVCFYTSFNFI
jgi:hypothetical protein